MKIAKVLERWLKFKGISDPSQIKSLAEAFEIGVVSGKRYQSADVRMLERRLERVTKKYNELLTLYKA